MNGDIGLSSIWIALAGGVVPALIAAFKRRAIILWYLYGFACTLVAWPLLALPTIHALLVWRHDTPKPSPQRQRRADALALIAESSVRSYPSWIADLRRKSPAGINRRYYAYKHLGPGEALELVRERSSIASAVHCRMGGCRKPRRLAILQGKSPDRCTPVGARYY
jgi:hypothetical protein